MVKVDHHWCVAGHVAQRRDVHQIERPDVLLSNRPVAIRLGGQTLPAPNHFAAVEHR